MDELTFAVCTFQRVFDTLPAHDLLTLDQLVRHMTRFELKPGVQRIIEREIARADLALDAWRAGEHRAGRHYSELSNAARAAASEGDDQDVAVAARHQRLLAEARKRAKQELRLWAPTLYKPGWAKRGAEGVAQLSCVVLDYDAGESVEAARLAWDPWFHVGHTTWSHTPEAPKFRVIVPLANPVRAVDWPTVWEWARAVGGDGVDPSCKGASRAYALPVVPTRDWPRAAWVHRDGALLDPPSEGLAAQPAPRAEVPMDPTRRSWFREPNDNTRYIDLPGGSSGSDQGHAAISDSDWDLFGPPAATPAEPAIQGATPPHAERPPPATPRGGGHERVLEKLDSVVSHLQRLERLIQTLAGVPADPLSLTAQLERLQTLYEDGALTDDEFERAKALLLNAP